MRFPRGAVYEPAMRSLARPLFILMTCGLCGAADCAQLLPKPDPQKTSINGSVQGRSFPNATAAFAQDPGPPRSLLVRVTLKSDSCEASQDPSDPLDPNVLITITPDQEGTFEVKEPGTAGTANRYATATMFTYTGMPDGGVPEGQDAGLRPVVVSAIGGTVEVKALDLDAQDGRLNADVTLLFENNEGLVGQVGAYPCDRVK